MTRPPAPRISSMTTTTTLAVLLLLLPTHHGLVQPPAGTTPAAATPRCLQATHGRSDGSGDTCCCPTTHTDRRGALLGTARRAAAVLVGGAAVAGGSPRAARAVDGVAYNAMLKRKAEEKAAEEAEALATEAARYADMRRTELGLRYSVVRKTGPASAPNPQRGQSVLCQYTLSVGGFPGDEKWEKVDGSTGFMKPPGGFGFYAGVGQAVFFGAPVTGFDLTIMDMVPGEARRVIVPPSLGFGDRGAGGFTGSKIPPGSNLYFEVELVELGDDPLLDDEQREFLRSNPIPQDRLLPLSASSAPPPASPPPPASEAPQLATTTTPPTAAALPPAPVASLEGGASSPVVEAPTASTAEAVAPSPPIPPPAAGDPPPATAADGS